MAAVHPTDRSPSEVAAALTGPEKAAVILLALPEDAASEVLKHLPRELVEPVVGAIANMGTVPQVAREAVFHEAETLFHALEEILEGGWEAAQRLLEHAYGSQRASEMLRRVMSTARPMRPFAKLSHSPPEHIAALIADEHPQTVALVLANLDARVAAQVTATLPEHIAAEATRRLARIETLAPTVVADLERTLESRLALTSTAELGGGLDLVVPILNATDTSREQAILDRIAERDPELAAQIRNQLFTFQDLATLDDGTLQTLLRRIDTRTLALALKPADEALRQRFFHNMSENAAAVLEEEMGVLSRVRMKDAEAAQHEITDLVHQLEESGEIVIPRGGAEEAFIE